MAHAIGAVLRELLAELREAGDRFGQVIGPNSVRILLLLGTAAVGETAALVSKAPQLPGFAKAAGALESHAGIRDVLTAAQEADQVKVAVAEGTFSVVLPAHVVSMAARGPPPRADPPKKKPDVHHIATVENEVSNARGGPWTPQFKEIFDRAGMRMKDAENTVPIEGHKGPHPERYHRIIFEELDGATEGCRSIAECRAALTKALTWLAEEIAARHGTQPARHPERSALVLQLDFLNRQNEALSCADITRFRLPRSPPSSRLTPPSTVSLD